MFEFLYGLTRLNQIIGSRSHRFLRFHRFCYAREVSAFFLYGPIFVFVSQGVRGESPEICGHRFVMIIQPSKICENLCHLCDLSHESVNPAPRGSHVLQVTLYRLSDFTNLTNFTVFQTLQTFAYHFPYSQNQSGNIAILLTFMPVNRQLTVSAFVR